MKRRLITQLLVLPGILWLVATSNLSAQYLETFSTPNKGYRVSPGPDDFSGVNWKLSSWTPDNTTAGVSGRDETDYFNTTAAGRLECIDLDQEVYWESPLLNIAAAGTVSLSVDLSWMNFDKDNNGNPCTSDTYGVLASLELIKVMYSMNGGAYTLVPNKVGGAACSTIGYAFDAVPKDSSAKISVTGLAGTHIRIRIVVNTNANTELVTIDNVSIPQNGVFVECTGLSINSTPGNPNVYTICTAYRNNDFEINTSDNNLDMKLVYFSSRKTGNSMYSGGTILDTAQSPSLGRVVFNDLGFPAPGTYYIYAILDTSDPDLASITCRPFVEFIITVTERPLPIIDVAENSETLNDGTITEGTNAVLTAKETGSFFWSTGAATSTITVSPLVTTTYSVTVTRDVCTGTASQVITVKPRTTPTTDLNADSYELKQNIPNPFEAETTISFSLPSAMKATLMVRDMKGALLYRQTGNYAKGENKVVLKKEQLGTSGVLYYTLETNSFTATKKMILLQ